jgi:DNA polymerase III alpha subunit
LSIHPGGVVVTPGPLTDVVPVQLAPKGFLITQFDSEDVEALGLPKIDLLGIRALTVMADAAALVRRWYAPEFRLEDIPLDDAHTGELLAHGETIGVFQCESAGAQRTLRQLKAHAVADLAIANAFFKPGPALGGMAQHFVLRYRGEEPVSYLHPSLEDILGPTKGVLIFQEQILRLAREIAGLSWEEADRLRKGMSKFHPDEMQAIRERFVRGCQRPAPDGPGLTEAQARTLWEQVAPFAGYGFNQGHATAYADVSYRSAYLKAHWPAAFLCGRLANWGGYHYASTYIAEARRLGIAVRPPHVNFSGAEFALVFEEPPASDGSDRLVRSDRSVASDTPETRHAGRRPVLYMGLNQVRDLRQQAVRSLVDEHERRPFAGLDDLLARVALQAKEVTHLVQCGALDGLGPHRAGLLAEAEQALRAGAGQFAFDFLRTAAAAETPAERLAWERVLLGQPVSVHPLDVVAGLPQDVLPLAEASKRPGQRVRAAGVRLPGWTGGKGFFLADRADYLTAVLPRGLAAPAAWEPVLATGRWQADAWGGGWLQVEALERLSFDTPRGVD